MARKGRGSQSGGDLIIVKREEGGGHAHHGGAWKVAYADFVTAMMAFFLLMWLINATTEEQRRGIADYFNPTNVLSRADSGSGRPFGGQTPNDDAALMSTTGTIQMQARKMRRMRSLYCAHPPARWWGLSNRAEARQRSLPRNSGLRMWVRRNCAKSSPSVNAKPLKLPPNKSVRRYVLTPPWLNSAGSC
jgi:flagellar motor protein MotB